MSRKVLIALVLLVACFNDLRFIDFGRRIILPIDYRVFWLTARAPLDEIYAATSMPFAYPPGALWLFEPLGLVSFVPGYVAWLSVSALLFGLAATRLVGARIAALSFLSPAALTGMLLGQSSMLLAGVTYMAFLLPPFIGGLALGLVAAIKPQLVLLAPLVLLVRREWKMLGGMAVGAIVPTMVATILRPSLWTEWFSAVFALREVLISSNVLSLVVTPAGRAEYFGLPSLPVLLAGLVLGSTAVIVAARRVEKEMLVALVTAASLVASPYAHIHDTIAMMPACLVLIIRGHIWVSLSAALMFTGLPDLTAISMLMGLAITAFASRLQHPAAAKP